MKANSLPILGLVSGIIAIGLSALALKQSWRASSAVEQNLEQKRGQIVTDSESADNQASAAPKVDSSAESTAQLPFPRRSATLVLPMHDAPATKEELEADAKFVVGQLLAQMPDEPRALHVSAMLNAQLHNTEQAVKLWSRCIELDAQVELYYVNLAAAALDRGDGQLAVKTLQQAVTRGFKSPDVLHHLSIALLNSGQTAEAAKLAADSLIAYPQSGALALILGQAQLKLGNLEAAEKNLRQAIELGVSSKPVYFSLFNVCMRLGKQEEAKQMREIYTSFKEKEIDVRQRFDVLSESEARGVCVSVLMEAANLYRAANQPQEVEHCLLRVLAIDSSNRAACRELAQFYDREKRFPDELIARERLIQLDRADLMNYLMSARAAVASGDVPKAEGLIKLAISMSPRTATGYAAMAEFLIEHKQPEKAVWYIQKALTIEPTRIGYQLLSRALRAAGKEREAKAAEEAGQKITNN